MAPQIITMAPQIITGADHHWCIASLAHCITGALHRRSMAPQIAAPQIAPQMAPQIMAPQISMDRRGRRPATIGDRLTGSQRMIAEHSLVVLDADPPHQKLTRGDVGTVVHVYKDAKGYEVEFVDGGGQTIALISVGADDVRPIQAGELLHTRIMG